MLDSNLDYDKTVMVHSLEAALFLIVAELISPDDEETDISSIAFA